MICGGRDFATTSHFMPKITDNPRIVVISARISEREERAFSHIAKKMGCKGIGELMRRVTLSYAKKWRESK